jgi:hypothetical protein
MGGSFNNFLLQFASYDRLKMSSTGKKPVWEKSLWYHKDTPKKPKEPKEKRKVFFLVSNKTILPALLKLLKAEKQAQRFFIRQWDVEFRTCKIDIGLDLMPGSKKEYLKTAYSPCFKVEEGKFNLRSVTGSTHLNGLLTLFSGYHTTELKKQMKPLEGINAKFEEYHTNDFDECYLHIIKAYEPHMRSLYSLNVIGRPLLELDDRHLKKVIYGHNTVAIYFLLDVDELQFTLIHIWLH